MTKDPLVSAIVSSFNGHSTLPNAIRSVLKQSYKNIEAIILDDGSSPPLSSVVEGIQDDRVRLLRFEENRGPYAGRDFAIRHSRGEIIGILDDDDAWLPAKIATQVPVLLRTPNVGLVSTGAIDIYPANKKILRLPPTPRISHRHLLTREWVINSSVVYRRSLYDEIGGYDISMRRCGDWDFHIRASQSHTVLAIPKALVVTHMNPGSLQRSQDIEGYELDQWRVIEKHSTAIQKNGLRAETLSRHYYSIGIRYLRNSHFAHARKYLIRSVAKKANVSGLLALTLAIIKVHNDFAFRRIARVLKTTEAKTWGWPGNKSLN